MNEQGLAQRSRNMPSIAEVVEMLKQGVSPEDLLAAGISEEMVRAALQVVMQANQQQEGMGLANSVVQPIKEGV